MPNSILEQIVNQRRKSIAQCQLELPAKQLEQTLIASDRNFYQALRYDRPAFILECKRASPSKGIIRKNFDLNRISRCYSQWASVISVLSEQHYFHGDIKNIAKIRSQVQQPILCKDFIVDPYQIMQARYYGADAVLLMLSVLDDNQYKTLSALAKSLNMGVLTEVSNMIEVDRALNLDAPVIGINNRNLHDLSVDLNRSIELSQAITDGRPLISESGISSHKDVQKLTNYVDGFLIGSSLMAKANIEQALKSLVIGKSAISQVNSITEASLALKRGAIYACIDLSQAQKNPLMLNQAAHIIDSVRLNWIGKFDQLSLPETAEIAHKLKLSVVDVGTDVSTNALTELRRYLPAYTRIWQHAVTTAQTQTA